jgi:hypothetical protein
VATVYASRVVCAECDAFAGDGAAGWRAFLAYDPREDEQPLTVSYCPLCARREFGATRRPEPPAKDE